MIGEMKNDKNEGRDLANSEEGRGIGRRTVDNERFIEHLNALISKVYIAT